MYLSFVFESCRRSYRADAPKSGRISDRTTENAVQMGKNSAIGYLQWEHSDTGDGLVLHTGVIARNEAGAMNAHCLLSGKRCTSGDSGKLAETRARLAARSSQGYRLTSSFRPTQGP